MDAKSIRALSVENARRLGYVIGSELPLLEEVERSRPMSEVFDRLLCVHATAACAYGFDRFKAKAWLVREGVLDKLSPVESSFLNEGNGRSDMFRLRIEALWALAWLLGIVSVLDFSRECDGGFVLLLPDLRKNQGAEILRERSTFRSVPEIVEAADLAYCLNWAARESILKNRLGPHSVPIYVIEERRRTLDWVLGEDAWDEISFDT